MEEILKMMAEPLGTLLLALVNAGIIMAIRWVHQHTKSDNVRMAVSTMGEVVQTEVGRLNQQVVEALKNDGKFDEQEQARIKQTALDTINKQLPPAVKKAAGYVMKDIEAYLNGLIEVSVVKAKALPPAT